LKNDTEINEMPCKKGWVHFAPNWQLTLFCLSEKTLIANRTFEKNTWIFTEPGNEYFGVVLPEKAKIDGYDCLGGGGSKGIQMSFYNSGELRSFFTKNDIEVSGVKCKGGILSPIFLHKNGKLKACKSAESITIKGFDIKKGAKMTFDENGNYILNER
jgi:hypothetical protein